MKRKLFFFLERLQITKNERITVAVLLILIAISGALNAVIEQRTVYNKEHYEELERIFGERSRQVESEHQRILARYYPEPDTAAFQPDVFSDSDSRPDTTETEGSGEESRESDRININKASAEELQQLPGIGPAYASRIVHWREQNGSFTSITQLIEIRGIGPGRLETLEPLITVDSEPE